MVTTFSLLLMNFGLNGFTEAVIQREDINESLVSNVFWINLSAGVLLTAAFAAAGSLVARFYKEPRVNAVVIGMSLTILITSASVAHLALMKRAMRFSFVSANEVAGRFVAVVLSILLAWAGWGYWALVAGAIAMQLSTSVGAWAYCRWLPSLPRRIDGTGSMVRFALNTYGRFTVNYLARNTDNALVGWRFEAQTLGFYKKAYDLFALAASQTVAPLTVVAVSALSRLNRDAAQYRKYLLSALGVVAFAGMGVGADLTLVGKDVIRMLLGPGWEPAGQIFAFFGPGIGVMLLYYTHCWIHLSIGRADRWFRWGIMEFIVTGLLFVLGLHWGPAGIAVAWTASFWILTIPSLWYAGRPIQFGVIPVLAVVWRYVVGSLVAFLASKAVIERIPLLVTASGTSGAVLRVVVISVLFGALYLGAVILLHQSCEPIYQVGRLLREMAPGSRLQRSSVAVETPSRNARIEPITP
jgi:PST family polysaccharide transporter